MKKHLVFFLLAVAVGCNKTDTPPNPDEVKLRKIKMTNSVNGKSTYRSFEYDNADRITKVFVYEQGETPEPELLISYSGNEATLTYDLGTNASLKVIFTLDNEKKPLKRIYNLFIESIQNGEHHKTYTNDTTVFEYTTAGLLAKRTGTEYDSVWVSNNGTETQRDAVKQTYIDNYTNTDNKLTEHIKLMNGASIQRTGSASVSTTFNTEEKTVFTFTKSYANKTDFRNAFLLQELDVFNTDYPVNRNYAQVPEKQTISRKVTTPSGSNTIPDAIKSRELAYNSMGLIGGLGMPRATINVELIYQ